MRQRSWTDTPFGHPDSWPHPLRSSVSLCLNSASPVCIYWGPEMCLLYNDAASLIPGKDHPGILGRPAGEFWRRVSSEMSLTLEQVMRDGSPAKIDDQLLLINRHGYDEECYFTHTTSPILTEDGRVIGVLNGLIETTARVLAQRRSRALQGLSRNLSASKASLRVAQDAVRELASNIEDLPFVALYRRAPLRGEPYELMAAEGQKLARSTAAVFAPSTLRVAGDGTMALPAWARPAQHSDSLPKGSCLYRLQPASGGPSLASGWGTPVRELLLLPLLGGADDSDLIGYLLCGINPRLRIDAAYGSFLEAVTLTTSFALSNAIRREQDRERAQVHRLALDTGRFGTWTFDPAQGELHLSERAAELFGYQGALSRCRLDWAIQRYHPEDRAAVAAAFQAAAARDAELSYEARLLLAGGEERWLWVRGSFYTGEGGARSMTGLVGDITERRRAEGLLRETEKLAAAGRLAATIAHEINNPLESVTNLIFLATLDDSLSPSTARLLRAADGELNRVTHIAQQTLGFYRDTLGPVPTEIQKTLTDTVRLFERRPDMHSVTIDLSRVKPVSMICFQGELRQVLSNLLANAVQASQAGSRVLVSARESRYWKTGEATLRLTVADYGSGVKPGDKAKLFQAFFTTKRDFGNGLGLWVSKSILEKHGGTIRFRSRSGRNSGTCFMITLPIQVRRSMVQ